MDLGQSPAQLERQVTRAWFVAQASRAVEAVCLGCSSSAAILLVGQWSAPQAQWSASLGPALCVGALIAGLALQRLSWSRARTAQELDRSLALSDALPAALVRNSAFASALAQRVLQRWDHGKVWAALLPRPLLVAPLALALAAGMELSGEAAPTLPGQVRARAWQAAAEQLATAGALADPEQQALRQDLEAAAAAEQRSELSPSQARALLARLQERLGASPKLSPALAALTQHYPAGGASAAAPLGQGREGSEVGLSSGAGDGTMGDSTSTGASAGQDPASPSRDAALPTAPISRWWPQRRDDLIQRWTAAQKTTVRPQ